MKVTILPSDKAVYVDGQAVQIKNFEDLGIAPNVEAVVWDSGLKRGEVVYKRPEPTVLDEAMFDAMFLHCIAHFENVDMDAKAAAEARRLADEAHSRKVEAMNAARDKKEATKDELLAKQGAELEALKKAVAKLTAQR
jgi:hypothetical protein